MKYMLLIYLPAEALAGTAPPDGEQQMIQAYNAYTQMLIDRGAMVAGEALHPPATASTVRVRDGKTLATDGPFAETKEQLGGFYIVEAKDLDEAIEFASKVPNAVDGSVEVRPLMVFE